MNQLRRLTSGLLSLALVGSTCTTWLPNVAAASRRDSSVLQAEQSTGSIALTLNFGLPQRVEEVRDRDIQLTLTGNDKNITVSLKDGSTRVTLADYSQHVLMSTANGTFSLGDVTGDGVVTAADRNALDEQLG